MGVFDVNATKLIYVVAEEFKKNGFKQPEWVDFVKTGMSRERAPKRRDWYFVRMASILYRLHKEGSLGTGSLRTYYGGRKNRGTQMHHFYRASGKIIRTCLQELEKQGLVKKAAKGRAITGKGQKILNEKSKIVEKLIEEEEKQKALREETKRKSEGERKVKQELRRLEEEKKKHGKKEVKEKGEKE